MKLESLLPCTKCLSLFSILSQTNPVLTFPSYSFKIHNNITHMLLGFSSVFFSWGIPTKLLYAFPFSVHATFSALHILLGLITSWCLVRNVNHAAPHRALFICPLLLPPTYFQMTSSVRYCEFSGFLSGATEVSNVTRRCVSR